MYFLYIRLSLFFSIWTKKPDASQLAVARRANGSLLLLGCCYGNERTSTVVLKCCIQGDCTASVKSGIRVSGRGSGGWGRGCPPLPPPLWAIVSSDRKREKFFKTICEDGLEVMRIALSLSLFVFQLLHAASHSRREHGVGLEARYCERRSYPGASHFF